VIVSQPVSIGYVQQHSDDIVYYLFEGPAPRDAVRVLGERTITFPGGAVVLAVIGSSHFLQLSAGSVVMTEMLASECPSLERLSLLARSGTVADWRHEVTRDGVAYRFELHRQGCSLAELRRETVRLASPALNRLAYRFPSDRGEEGALTCLEWHAEDSRLTVETYHTYPCEPAMVLTRSVVDLPNRGDET
jgi:hypothetical protein